ncbi:MAG: dTMP kinase [Gammaproteobacteria bacterium]|nr:dTMP kinase [Gammaproteobacteria bacterium]MBV9698159.1 dTMP kinase [Gammaproteobacteria bacterium]
MRGRFITLEGIEGAGKSTQSAFIAQYLRAQGLEVVTTREPGGTPLAERVRALVLERGAEAVTPLTETLLMFAARSLHVAHVLRPALARGAWVVCDRFTDASRAYQGMGRGVDPALIEALARAVHGDLTIDCTLLFDLPVAEGLARARSRAGTGDRFESETLAFHERVRQGYLALAALEPRRVQRIDAAAPPAAVQAAVQAVLERLLAGGRP